MSHCCTVECPGVEHRLFLLLLLFLLILLLLINHTIHYQSLLPQSNGGEGQALVQSRCDKLGSGIFDFEEIVIIQSHKIDFFEM